MFTPNMISKNYSLKHYCSPFGTACVLYLSSHKLELLKRLACEAVLEGKLLVISRPEELIGVHNNNHSRPNNRQTNHRLEAIKIVGYYSIGPAR